ncbi:hypothetical protein EP51_43980 (plasmid) [Rhodococcus opacus]|uniref:Uncharacterized protein n=1 Tax=Rhodococcus opacus TaxID=37919 RepID=A0A076F0U2_RHOOP|nr:hypothetical protein EP51_43980 [Rhodococcus opacus]OUS81983.1 hypothetical protein CA951_41380 [Rhodococcus sp. NCIMB 12038]
MPSVGVHTDSNADTVQTTPSSSNSNDLSICTLGDAIAGRFSDRQPRRGPPRPRCLADTFREP